MLSSLGIIVGLSTMIAAARSLTGRLRTIQDGLARVEEGDLDVAIGVDDAGELGQLQRGFDRMVAGLRERRDLENLFGRHVGVDVARQALARGPSLGGEQREASALFVDVIGSARLALERSPTDVVSLLNDFFAAVVEVATAHGGWVNKFEGDGALCVFGVLSETPEHSAAALRASRVLRSRLDVLAQAHPGLDAAIGVASGTVVAGNVGAEERYEYTVIGEPVNAASRLTEEAKNHASRLVAAAVSVETAGEESRHWRSPGAVTLRGWGEPTKICEPV